MKVIAHSLRDDGRPEGEEMGGREPEEEGPKAEEHVRGDQRVTLELQTV